MEKKCCICKKEFVGYGDSALPIKNGVCCDYCNAKFVIPSRVRLSKIDNPKTVSYEIVRTSEEFLSLSDKLTEKGFTGGKILLKEGCMVYKNPETEEKVDVIMALEVE